MSRHEGRAYGGTLAPGRIEWLRQRICRYAEGGVKTDRRALYLVKDVVRLAMPSSVPQYDLADPSIWH